MAFNIESLKEINKIEKNISDRKKEMNDTFLSANSSLDNLKANMSGYGVDKNLTTLQDSITKNAQNVNDLLDRILIFIKDHTGEYSASEQALMEQLKKAQEELNNIKF